MFHFKVLAVLFELLIRQPKHYENKLFIDGLGDSDFELGVNQEIKIEIDTTSLFQRLLFLRLRRFRRGFNIVKLQNEVGVELVEILKLFENQGLVFFGKGLEDEFLASLKQLLIIR